MGEASLHDLFLSFHSSNRHLNYYCAVQDYLLKLLLMEVCVYVLYLSFLNTTCLVTISVGEAEGWWDRTTLGLSVSNSVMPFPP